MFVLWNGVILGTLPPGALETAAAATAAGDTFDPLETLRGAGGAFGGTVRAFSLLAISTSFIGFCYGAFKVVGS